MKHIFFEYILPLIPGGWIVECVINKRKGASGREARLFFETFLGIYIVVQILLGAIISFRFIQWIYWINNVDPNCNFIEFIKGIYS